MMDILKAAFIWVLISSFTGSILAVLVMLIQKVLKNRISSRVCVILWLLVFLRLAVAPFAPGSPISVFNIFSYGGADTQKENTTQIIWSSIKKNKPYLEYNTTDNLSQTFDLQAAEPLTDENKKAAGAKEIRGGEYRETAFNSPIWSILSLAWAFGLLVTAVILSYSAWYFSRQMKSAEMASDLQLLSIIDSCRRRLGIEIEIPVFISDDMISPCMSGIRRPRLVIPRKVFEFTDCQQITHICMHELSHLKRRDHLLNLPVTVIAAIHWFNPALWYAIRQFNLTREISCDAHALEVLGQEERIPYGMTLIHFTRFLPQRRLQFSLLGFCETKKQIERRIIMIKNFKKGSYRMSVVAIVLCLALGSVTLTNAANTTGGTGMASNSAVQNDTNSKFRLNDSTYYFYSLERAQNFSGLTFKVPDLLPSGYELYEITLSKNDEVNSDIVTMAFADQETKYGKYFAMLASKGDLIKGIKYIGSKSTGNSYQMEPMEVSGIKGTCLIQKTVHDKPDMGAAQGVSISAETECVEKYFVWTEGGIWYGVKYNSLVMFSDGHTNNMSISNLDLKKLVSSMKEPKEVQKANYVSKLSKEALNIYDETDLKQANEMLGFAPKFPLSLPEGFNLCFSQIMKASYKADSHKLTPYTMEFVRSSDHADLWLESTYLTSDKTKWVELDQVKSPLMNKIYDYLKTNKYIERQNQATKQAEHFTVKALQVSGTEVLTFKIDNVSYYVWMQNNVFNQVQQFDDGMRNMEDILKALITQVS